MVDLFLNPTRVPQTVEQAIEIGVNTVWMQLGVIHDEAALKAKESGIQVVMDRCMPTGCRRMASWSMILCMSDYPRTLLEFQKLFPDEAAGSSHLDRIWWQEGYKRPCCGQVDDPFRIQARAARA